MFWGEPIALRAMYQSATFQNSVPKRLENLENECDQGQVMQFARFPAQDKNRENVRIKGCTLHNLAAGCMDFKPCAPGVCMYIQNYEYLYIEMYTRKDSRVHDFVYVCHRRVHRIIP